MAVLLWLVLSIFLTILLNGNLADICGFTSEVEDTDHKFVVVEDQGGEWTLQMNFSWTEPSGGFDAYYIKLVDPDARVDYQLCKAKESYQLTTKTWHLFDGLQFGFPYEVRIHLYNSETDKTSFAPTRFPIDAPDCHEKTGSIEYCMQQPIPTATKVRDPQVESISLNNFGNGTDVVISWLPPVQINGVMDTVTVSYREETALANEGVIAFRPADVNWNGDRWERFNTTLPSLLKDVLYIVTIKPIVTKEDTRLFGEGLYFNVTTSLSVDSDIADTPVYATNPSSLESTTESKKSFFTHFSAEWQWVLLCILTAIILICTMMVLLFIRMRRKSQRMTVVSS